MRKKDRSPVFAALAIQAVVFGGLYLLRPLVEEAIGRPVPLLWLVLAQGLIAGIATRGFGFSAPWVIGQVIAPPLLLLALALDLPSWIFPVILILLLLVFWNVAVGRVPLFLTNRTTSAALLKLLPQKKGLHMADLGSGLGGTLRHLAKERPAAQFTGLETAPLPFALSWMLGRLNGAKNLDFRFRDIFKEDLGKFDVVYCFLSPVPMPALFEKAKAEMKPGSLFISNSFEVPGRKPQRTVKVDDRRQTKLLIWKM
ncbi:class I SAM-dependent methyltransferase [Sneathiella sp.]|uniref:class I SAM-dependent methyltransferase n=1 Tax=Sneathiella sp. TaxID=1964365 RepID=UPI00262487F2|nr:class I SAM-dependent methyltransferase [Sneathiella sp.]MDF2366502.1 class I SAM-dependent methyltransferase [Sneathiella sp.]